MPLVLTQSGTLVWRQYNTDGVSGSGNHQPAQADIVVWARELEARASNALGLTVIRRDLTSPPGASVGDRYILPVGALGGAWSAFSANDIVEWDGAAWLRATPQKGWRAWITLENIPAIFSGTVWWYVGQYIEQEIVQASELTLVISTAKTIAQIDLPGGDWDISGVVRFNGGATTVPKDLLASISLITNTLSSDFQKRVDTALGSTFAPFAVDSLYAVNIGPVRVTPSVTTTYFLIAYSDFTTSTLKASGAIRARRFGAV